MKLNYFTKHFILLVFFFSFFVYGAIELTFHSWSVKYSSLSFSIAFEMKPKQQSYNKWQVITDNHILQPSIPFSSRFPQNDGLIKSTRLINKKEKEQQKDFGGVKKKKVSFYGTGIFFRQHQSKTLLFCSKREEIVMKWWLAGAVFRLCFSTCRNDRYSYTQEKI